MHRSKKKDAIKQAKIGCEILENVYMFGYGWVRRHVAADEMLKKREMEFNCFFFGGGAAGGLEDWR